MSKIQRILQAVALALTVAASGAALAESPSYHVSINTGALSGGGYMFLSFLSVDDAPGATAAISHFDGAFNGFDAYTGSVADGLPDGATMTNANGMNALQRGLSFGGVFSFNVSFYGDYETMVGGPGAMLGISLINEDFTAYVGNPDGNVLEFSLLAPLGTDPAGMGIATPYNLATVTAVPEASQWLMLVAGLAMLGWTMRRRA